MQAVVIPKEDVNDDHVILCEICVLNGDKVEKDQKLLTVETTKSVFDVTAPCAGYVRLASLTAGDRVPLEATVGWIAQTSQELETVTFTNSSASVIQATEKAKALALEHGIDLLHIKAQGLIREKDVQEFIHSSTEQANTPEISAAAVLSKDFVRMLQADGLSFRNLESHEKVDAYRSHGALIGQGVVFAPGSMIITDALTIEDGVRIGANTYIKADSVVLNAMVHIGSDNHLVSGKIQMGEGTRLSSRIRVDLAGGKDASSALIIGRQCVLAQEVYINVAHQVTIADRSALSPRAMIFTHSYCQSVLDGYPASFGPVKIGQESWVGAGAQVLPGIHIGNGSVIMSNSLVTQDVADYVMVGGVPAVVIKQGIKKQLSPAQRALILSQVMRDFLAWLSERGLVVEPIPMAGAQCVKISLAGKEHLLVYPDESGRVEAAISEEAVVVSLHSMALPPKGGLFDIEKKEFLGVEGPLAHELRNFLRRRGIRFCPWAWQYSSSKGMFA